MNVDLFEQQIEALGDRVAALVQRTEESPSQQQLLKEAFEEFYTAMKELKVAESELLRHNEQLCQENLELAVARMELEAVRRGYQDLFEEAPDAYLVTDVEGTIQQANRAAATMLNADSAQSLVGQTLVRFVADKERHAFDTYLTKFHSLNGVGEWETRLSPRDSKSFDAALKMNVVRNQDGLAIALRISIRALTNRKRTELALQESNERFRLLIEGVRDYAIFMLDPNGYIASWNVGAERIFGYQESEIIGKHFSCMFTPEDIQNGEPEQELKIAVVEGKDNEERWHIRKNGTSFWGSNHVTPLQDDAGKLRGFSKVVHDMTQSKRPESALQQLNADLDRQVQERTAQLRQSLDFEAMLKRITDKVRDSLDESQILQTAVQELALGLNLGGCNASWYNLADGTSTICYEYVTSIPEYRRRAIQMADFPKIYQQLVQGQYFQFCSIVPSPVRGRVAMLACPIVDDQGVLGDLWLINQQQHAFNELEIRLVQQVANQCAIAIRTARLYQASLAQVEELEKLNQLKDDFLSTVSHELRTPVSNMKMAIHMLRTAPAGEARERYLNILHQECAREIELINNLLDLQRLEAATYLISRDVVSLEDWLPTIIEPFQLRTQERQQILRVVLPPSLQSLSSDRTSLGRVLAELLNNAYKYTPPEGEIVFSVSQDSDYSAKFSHPKASSELDVVTTFTFSNQAEIPASELPRIFEKLYRVPKADPWKQGGTGLGLALVKKLVEQLQGSIQVESSNGWTTFTVQLPNQPRA